MLLVRPCSVSRACISVPLYKDVAFQKADKHGEVPPPRSVSVFILSWVATSGRFSPQCTLYNFQF